MAGSVEEGHVIGSAYEAATNQALWPVMLGAVARYMGCRGALMPARHFLKGQLLCSPGMEPVLDQFFSQGWYERDLRTEASMPLVRHQEVVTDQTILPEAELDGSDYYNGFARKAGVPWFAAAILGGDADGYVAISLQRSATERMFDANDVRKLRRLLPHLRNATAVAMHLSAARSSTLVDGLSLGGQAGILIDAVGQVVAVNAEAEALLGDALIIRQGRLMAANSRSQSRLNMMINLVCSAVSDTARVGPVVLEAAPGGTALVARIAPVERQARDVFGLRGAIILLMRQDRPMAAPQDVLIAMFGLTPGEARVLNLLADGHTLADISDRLEVTREAVRFHLKSIFLKTDTHRQSELVAMLMRLSLFLDRGQR